MGKEYCTYCMGEIGIDGLCSSCGQSRDSYIPSPHHLPPGTVLKERYLIGRVLGEGGFGITYIGCDLRLDMKVAVKEYFPIERANRIARAGLSISPHASAAGNIYEEGKNRFLQEARTMAKMGKQRTIVSVRDCFEENNTAYIVMEYIEGITLKELVCQKGPVPSEDLLGIMKPLFAALEAMHQLGLAHRDISPENLMLENGEVRLLDFGCARESGDGDATLTITLKHGYAPVEQYQNKGQGPWSDVYALSATIYYCLTARKPPQSLDRLVEDLLVPPRELGALLTGQQEKALIYGMGIRPRRRYQTVSELYAALYGEVAEEAAAEAGSEGMAMAPLAGGNPSCGKDTKETEKIEWENNVFLEKKNGSRKVWRGICCGIAAVFALMLFGAAICYQRGRFPFGRTMNAQEAASMGTDEIWNGIILLDNGNAEDFLLLLADEEISAIHLVNCHFRVSELFEIRKPVYVSGDTRLDIPCLLTVGENGFLLLDGAALDLAQLFVADGGAVTVVSGAVLSAGSIWAEHTEAITIRDGASIHSNEGTFFDTALLWEKGGVFLWPGEKLFTDALHVATEEEYHIALLREKAVIIEGDLELSAESLPPQSIPVQIAKGVTVTISGELSFKAGAVLVNYGSIKGSLRYKIQEGGGVAVINYGAIHADMCLPNDSRLLNYGVMQIPQGQFLWSEAINIGEIIVGQEAGQADLSSSIGNPNADCLEVIGRTFHNYGRISIKNENCRNPKPVILDMNELFYNSGTIHIGQYGRLKNENYLENTGMILCTEETGGLQNQGRLYVWSRNATLDLGRHATEYNVNTGILIYGMEEQINCPAEFQDGGGRAIIFDWRSTENYATVETPEELSRAMEDDGCQVILVNEDIVFPGKLTITKGVAVSGSAALSVEGLEVRGEEAFFYSGCSVDLNGGTLVAEDGVVLIEGEFLHCGGIVIEGKEKGGKIMLALLNGLMLSNAQIKLGHGELDNLGNINLDGVQIEIGENGLFRAFGFLNLSNCGIEILAGGELSVEKSFGGIYMDETTKVANHGLFTVDGWEQERKTILGEIENYGTFYLSGDEELGGSFTNYGTVLLEGESIVTGYFENKGSVSDQNGHGRLKATQGGKITGLQ